MDIVDFVEQVFDIELFDYQKVLFRGQRRLFNVYEDANESVSIFVDSTKPTEDYHRNGYTIVWSGLDEMDGENR